MAGVGIGVGVAVFNHVTITSTRVVDISGDSHVPITRGAADGNRITSPGFLQGTGIKPGQDQVLIRSGDQSLEVAAGNRWVEVKGNQTEHITGTLETNIDIWEHHVVKGRGRKTEITAKEDYLVIGVLITMVTQQSIRTTIGGECKSDPLQTFDTTPSRGLMSWWQGTLTAVSAGIRVVNIGAQAIDISVAPVKLGFGLIKYDSKAANFETGVTEFRGDLVSIVTGGLRNWLTPWS